MKRKVFVSPECLTSDQFWSQQKVAESESESSDKESSKKKASEHSIQQASSMTESQTLELAKMTAQQDENVSLLSSKRNRTQTDPFSPECCTKTQSPNKPKTLKVAQALHISDDDESKIDDDQNSEEDLAQALNVSDDDESKFDASPPAINLTTVHHLDSLPQNLLLTYAYLKDIIESCPGISLLLSDDKELSMVVEVMCKVISQQTKDVSEQTEETIRLLSQVPFVHLIFTQIPSIPLEDEVKKLDGQRILTVYKMNTGVKGKQDTCCMTDDSFNEYCVNRDPQSQTDKMALINLRQLRQQKPVSDTSGLSFDWRVDKLDTYYIKIDINKEILYCPDENSKETMRPLQIRSLMAKLPSFLRKTLPHEEYCMSKKVCLFESMLTFASKFEDITSTS